MVNLIILRTNGIIITTKTSQSAEPVLGVINLRDETRLGHRKPRYTISIIRDILISGTKQVHTALIG